MAAETWREMPAAPAGGQQPAGNGWNGYSKRGKGMAGWTNTVRRSALLDICRRCARAFMLVSLLLVSPQVSERMDDRRRLPEQQEEDEQDRQPALPHGTRWK